MKKTDRDWAQLAKENKGKASSGHVGVGAGEVPRLQDLFGVGTISILGATSQVRGGAFRTSQYQTPVENWEKITGLNYAETIGEEKEKQMKTSYYTKYSPHLKAFIKEILEGKKADFEIESGYTDFLFYNGSERNSFVSDATGSTNWPDFYEEVTNAEFVVRISALPDKEKEFTGKIAGVDSVIAPDKIKIGCQEYTPEQFAEIGKAVKIVREGIKINFEGKPEIKIDSEKIRCEGMTFKLTDFDFAEEKLKELSK